MNALHTFDGNPRRGAVDKIARSLEAHGQYRPIVVNQGSQTGRPNEVLAGNHTLLAARTLDWTHISVALIDVDDATAKSIVAADNRLADLGDYDAAALFELLDSLDDLSGTGYGVGDLEALRKDLFPPEVLTDPDEAPSVPAEPISEPGQIWTLGENRLLVDLQARIAQVLERHRYSASPWSCLCGAHLQNSDLRTHQAQRIVDEVLR